MTDATLITKITTRFSASKRRLLEDAELAISSEKYPIFRSRMLDELGSFERELKVLLESSKAR